jgi:phosphohistidine phosphatase
MATSRRLIVLRHATSEPQARGQGDHARPLDPHGRAEALDVGTRLCALGWVPQAVICSDATRARQTWAHMQPGLRDAATVDFTPTFYLMGITEIRAALRHVAPEVDTVIVLGHNPGWEDAVRELCGVRVRMAPCHAALLSTAAASWHEASERGDWSFETIVRPELR